MAWLTVSAWAEQYRKLSSVASAEAGQWRNDRTPYLAEIMDCLSQDSPVNRVVFSKGSQIGGTEAGLNWALYVMAHAPGPGLLLSAGPWNRRASAPRSTTRPFLISQPR